MTYTIPSYLSSFTDLYGRGYSDAPKTTYDTTLYTTQLALLMQYLKWDKANIVGLSMVRFRYLQRVGSLTQLSA